MTTAFPSELEALLADDVPYGDLTTAALGIGSSAGRMTFKARGQMVVAEVESAVALLRLAGCESVTAQTCSGDVLEAGAVILTATGSAEALHRGWKVSQTLIEAWSGVASAARAIVEAARRVAPDIGIACTRKNTPGTKSFAARAVQAGGASMHRLGLSESVLVFPEHRAFLADVPLAELVARLRRAVPEKKLVIEAKSIATALEAAAAGFDVVQAEKLSPADIQALVAALKAAPKRPLIAAAGGITTENAAEYAGTGADVLVTSMPYFARPRDVAVSIEAV
ncbi:putative pyrophosphorylase ModD [Hyphomicrobium sp. 1Nfss2.1]|uniref:ModD protein n=1 Tax=Hyphomicrobium sp. 1Nfss2.1 TaxID=3413936 RepID=UPI003C7B1AB0